MKSIAPEINIPYDAVLKKKYVPLPAHFHYRKWLCYYMDVCLNYYQEAAIKESFAPFVQKLKD